MAGPSGAKTLKFLMPSHAAASWALPCEDSN